MKRARSGSVPAVVTVPSLHGCQAGSGFVQRCHRLSPGPGIVVVHLLRVEIHAAARRHGVRDEDIEHAFTHSVTWTELGEDPSRYLFVGPARTGNLLELVVVDVGGEELVIHAMSLRRSTAEELFGGER